MQSIARPEGPSTHFAFASFGGQLAGILARQGDRFYFFTDTDDQALDVTTCPMIYLTGTVNASRDAYYQAQLEQRRRGAPEEV